VPTIEDEFGLTRGQSRETLPKEPFVSGCRVHARARLCARPTALRRWRWRAGLTCLLAMLFAVPAVVSTNNSAAALTATVTTGGTSANVSQLGQSVTLTAAVTAEGVPVTEGEVTFSIGNIRLGFGVLDESGMANMSTTELAAGMHYVDVDFEGTEQFGGSRDTLVIFVDDPSNIRVVCSPEQPCYPPPPLLNLDQGLYRATGSQTASLRKLEAQAVDGVIELHGLSSGDTAAVQTWGRAEAQGALFGLLMGAIDASNRTTDQQNAVDWMTAVAQRKAVHAAESAGFEYVRWAGLNEDAFGTLLSGGPTESDLKAFLDDPPRGYNSINTAVATRGYCKYRSPDPYSTEYTGRVDPTCFAPCANILGCLPPTPSYDQFVKWGEAAATYSFLNSEQFSRAAYAISAAAGMSAGLAAAIPTLAAAPVAAPFLASLILTGAASVGRGTFFTPFGGSVATVAGVAFIAGVVIVALTIAITQGLAVINASQLPGQLAQLIRSARTNAPDLTSVDDTSNGKASLLALFVGATLPTPIDSRCDNSNEPRNYVDIVSSGPIILGSSLLPCMNASDIPAPAPDDARFEIREDGATTTTQSATITWKDSASGKTTTARLHKNWFITETDGTVAQTLPITYTDWDGNEQTAYVSSGDPTQGYVFVRIKDSEDDVDFATCVADGTCVKSSTLEYVGPDGKRRSAEVAVPVPPTGAPTYRSADEGQPLRFDANGFAPGDAVGEVSYQWRFQGLGIPQFGSIPYGAPVSGAKVAHTWGLGGRFAVELTAADPNGHSATTTFWVDVGNIPPKMALAQSEAAGAQRRLAGTVEDATDQSMLTTVVNRGDGGPWYKALCTPYPVGSTLLQRIP
jgi:Bacterial Ig-like domain (group 3)/PKD domain